ncbi:hypothetical protein [Phaeodactylibacter xiamenensis]|uniref:hypothetical protein n=1 Tax=Phaeodactylibacter xiamenensis TaxID=1524460 RepID=UPI003BA9FDCC
MATLKLGKNLRLKNQNEKSATAAKARLRQFPLLLPALVLVKSDEKINLESQPARSRAVMGNFQENKKFWCQMPKKIKALNFILCFLVLRKNMKF